MRILHLAPTGNWAGTETMVAAMANALAMRHEIGVVFKTGPNISARDVRGRLDDRVMVHVVDSDSSPGEIAGELVAMWGVPDLVHAHLRPGLEVAWRLRDLAPVLGHLHVRYFSSQLWWVDAVACVSPWQVDDIPDAFEGAVYLIPNSLEAVAGVDLGRIQNVRRSLGSGGARVVYGAIGRMSEEKGHDTLIGAFRKVDTSDSRLVIIGEGEERERLEQLAGDDPRIIMPGHLPDARELLPVFDVYVSGSRLESFGLSVLEAMTAGLRIVATAARGPSDLLAGQPATLVPIDDIDAMAAAMSKAGEAVRRGAPSPAYEISEYGLAATGDKLEDVYQHMVRGRSTATRALRRTGLQTQMSRDPSAKRASQP